MKTRTSLFLMCTFLCAASSLAQKAPTVSILDSPAGPAPINLSAIDLNNDGITDLVQTGDTSPAEFDVSIGKGGGTFRAPVRYPIAAATNVPLQFTAGDFNGDGKIDLVFTLTGTTRLAVALGNGDGSFQPVRYVSLQLVAGEKFSASLPVVAGDFNHDGKQDLVVAVVSPPYPRDPFDEGPQDLYLIEGDGAGNFPTSKLLYTVPQDVMFETFASGDFNSDTNADIVFSTKPFNNPFLPPGTYEVHVLFGDGSGGFEDHPITVLSGGTFAPTLSAGDVNGDGRTDFFFVNGATDQLDVYLGNPDKTFTVRTSDMPSLVDSRFGTLGVQRFALADFNDDGRMDLVTYAPDDVPQTSNLLLMLGGDPPGTFTYQVIPLPHFYFVGSEAMVGEFNGDSKPDIAVGQYDVRTLGSVPRITTAINSTSGGLWSNCPYSMGARKISLCSPIQYAPGQVSFDASASSFGALRKMELWVDGGKIAEQHHVWENQGWLNLSSPFSVGMHHGALYTADVDNTLDRLDFTFTIGIDPCTAPAKPGVNICKPWGSSFVNSPTTVQANANLPGSLARMEIWVDGVKKFTEAVSTWFDADVELTRGQHTIAVFAVNTAGSKWMKMVTFTVE